MNNVKFLETIITVFVRFGSKAVNFIVFLLVARSLSVADMGMYGLIFSSALIFSVLFDFGLRNSSAVFISGDIELAKRSSSIMHICWVVFSLLGIGAISILPNIFDSMSGLNNYLLQFLVLFVAMLYIRLMQGVLLGVGFLADFNKSEVASRLILIVITLYFYFSGGITIDNALWSLATSQVVAAVYLVAIIIKNQFLSFSVPTKILQTMLKRGVVFMLAVVLMNISKRFTFYALGESKSLESSGIFFSLLRTSEIVTEIALAVGVVLFSYSVRAKEKIEVIQGIASTARHMTLVLFLVTALMFTFSSEFMNLLLPSIGVEGLAAFDLILWATFLASIWILMFPSFTSVVNPLVISVLFIPSIVFLAVVFYIDFISIHRMDLYFASILYLISNLLTLGVFLGFSWLRFKVSPFSFLILKRSEISTVYIIIISRFRRLFK